MFGVADRQKPPHRGKGALGAGRSFTDLATGSVGTAAAASLRSHALGVDPSVRMPEVAAQADGEGLAPAARLVHSLAGRS